MTATDDDKRLKARNLFWQGFSPAEIARDLCVPYPTVDSWKRRDKWEEAPTVVRIEAHLEARLNRLIAKETKTDRDFFEIGQLAATLERTARIQRYSQTGKETDLNPNLEARARGRKKKAEQKNALTEEQVAALRRDFHENLFGYQKVWHEAKRHRVRNILKSRQIGATWYFAREAFLDAAETGDNQIFLSASKAQAHVFRGYIFQWVKDVTGGELKGDPIVLWNGATLYFLGTNSKTAQSYHGHVYLDEYAWISKFLEFRKVASAMATHKKWRITYFSTPSTIGHEANAFWNGETFNKGKAKENRVAFDVSHETLKHGAVGPDGTWRHMVTIRDAEESGCDLFDVDALLREYNDADFANLFMCEWVDDTASFFGFDELRKGMVDSWEVWADFHPHLERPFGDRPVWIGYDPAQSADNASIAVVAPPAVEGGKFRVLEKLNVSGADFQAQAARIKELRHRYNVEHIGIDTTTIGAGVFEMVRQFFPRAVAITYSVEVKTRLVLKAKQLFTKRRIEFDAGWSDVAAAFMAIRRTATASGRQATFSAGRSKETGHADIAWAIMHALDRLGYTEFDNVPGARRKGFMEIF
ncbi:Terminase, ATPase subunit [uncultured Alphaproteobacteria bacterium]|uniref:Terminase, ATPase subunit n=1 Tax=uncultured Alphaproteobacteria bacterium TaxID=91750 RepID=A0A212J4B0_9PROT|nr:Terminase, ATPase subunit [uncultured Alphaproteobacteria bacterium]